MVLLGSVPGRRAVTCQQSLSTAVNWRRLQHNQNKVDVSIEIVGEVGSTSTHNGVTCQQGVFQKINDYKMLTCPLNTRIRV